MAAPLFSRHSTGLAAVYADLENHALNQGRALIGTPGSVSLRSNADGAKFHVRQYYDHDRTKRDQYIAAQGSPDVASTRPTTQSPRFVFSRGKAIRS